MEKDIIASLLGHGRWPQAVVLEGGSARQRSRMATLLAQAAVCDRKALPPCEACRACRLAGQGHHPDVAVLQGDGTQKSLSVDLIRGMRAEAFVRPNQAERKVFLLLEADCMNASAQNAMLKILEEPPAYVMFVIAVESRSSLLGTVLSRSVSVSLGEAREEDAAPGGIWVDFLQAFARGDEPEMLALSASVERDRLAQKALLEGVLSALRDALALRSGSSVLISGQTALAESLGRVYTKPALFACFQAVEELRERAEENANGPLIATLLCARLRAAVN